MHPAVNVIKLEKLAYKYDEIKPMENIKKDNYTMSFLLNR